MAEHQTPAAAARAVAIPRVGTQFAGENQCSATWRRGRNARAWAQFAAKVKPAAKVANNVKARISRLIQDFRSPRKARQALSGWPRWKTLVIKPAFKIRNPEAVRPAPISVKSQGEKSAMAAAAT